MANKVSYANLKLKVDESVNTFDFNGQTIEVLKYLPIDDKYSLVNITLQKSFENGIYNAIKVDTFFHLHLVYMYTNLSFTDKQKENEMKLYDTLKSNGFIDKMLETIEESEYDFLYESINEIISDTMNYKNTAGAVLQSLINDLPKSAAAAAEIVESFDKDKYQEVIKFAEAANGGRAVSPRQNIKPVDNTGKTD
jgi:hypothetical protein